MTTERRIAALENVLAWLITRDKSLEFSNDCVENFVHEGITGAGWNEIEAQQAREDFENLRVMLVIGVLRRWNCL